MRTLYIDCGMGAAGDMLTAALLELLPNPDAFLDEMNGLGIPGVTVRREAAAKCGIQGTHITVSINGEEEAADGFHAHEHEHGHEHTHEHGHEHEHEYEHGYEHAHEHEHGHEHPHIHRGMQEIESIIRGLRVSDKVKADILSVYGLIANAESAAHGVPVSEIHFHEVGTMDAIADITAVCLLMEKLAVERVVVSPVHVGCGHVRCAHGILPVPAPATATILKDVPMYGGSVKGELCTPTGAALLKHFASAFGEMPILKTHAVGYGMGSKDFEAANCVRVLLGETADTAHSVLELSCNVDDMTAEELGFAMERLLDSGALEVFTIPAGMKKSRPGVLLQVLCREEDRETLVNAIFRHTSTIGVRETKCTRHVLSRTVETMESALGSVRCKRSSGYGVERCKFEYEDLARIAREKEMSLAEVRRALAEEL